MWETRRKLPIWSNLLTKSLMENFFLCSIFLAHFNYVPTMEHSGSPVLNPLRSLVILFSIGNHSYCVMEWRERPTVSVKKNSLWNFPIQISEPRQGSILAGSYHKLKYQDFSLILPSFRDWFMTIIRKYND